MKISKIFFDENKLFLIQENIGELLEKIDANKSTSLNKKEQIFKLIEQRMFRYAVRIRDEFGLKTENEIKDRFYIIVNDITNHCFDMIEKSTDINQEDINILHTKLFPKGMRGQTKGPGGRAVKVLYKTGELRKHREFVKYNGEEYDYLDFKEIENAINEVFNFYKKSDLHILIKIFYFISTILYIHPYYNGNGTLYRIVTGILLLQNGYSIPKKLNEYLEFDNDLIYNFRHNGDYEPLIKGFLELFETEI